jgi:uncharacterized protein (TIGR02246 family)
MTIITTTSAAVDVIGRLQEAWNRGDGASYGAEYTEGASHLTVRGETIYGREAIGAGHAGIFATIYAGSVLDIDVLEVRALGQDVVVATTRNTLDVPGGPLAGTLHAVGTLVMVRADGRWRVEASHNSIVGA